MTDTVIYKRPGSIQIAYITAQINSRDEIPALLSRLYTVCQNVIVGKPMVIFHGGAVKEGYLIEAAYPVSSLIENMDIHTRTLESAPMLSMLHRGSHQIIRDTVRKIYEYLDTHAWTTSLFRQEIYHVIDSDNPENNLTEVQVILHEWEKLLIQGSREVLGNEDQLFISQGVETISPETTFEEYTNWIQGAMERLDSLNIDNDRKCQIVSRCAHVFPQERIDYLRHIYETRDFDDILRDMYQDNFWYEKPVRKGNVLYMKKNPFDPETYKQAKTPAEQRKAYCHCSFVHPYLDEVPSKLSPTFCYCGAGWYRRLWEGILGKPVKFEQVETLLRGNDQCTFTITLPLDLDGECLP